MSVRNLTRMFTPRSVALIGASQRERSVGGLVAQNLIGGGFTGPVLADQPQPRRARRPAGVPDGRGVAAGCPISP